ncbi:MAG: hypothetical protein IJ599_01060 [Alphaproteobacteria bacterium]|nr:hypothetical protein [Alphaproteobacteria bacterium]
MNYCFFSKRGEKSLLICGAAVKPFRASREAQRGLTASDKQIGTMRPVLWEKIIRSTNRSYSGDK